MIKEFVARFQDAERSLRENITHPDNYEALVKKVIQVVTSQDNYGDFNPDPARVHAIDDGDYQGTLVFVIGAKGYQPSDYWYVKVSYGSCSGCDTLEDLKGYSDDPTTQNQRDGYVDLMLHIVQGLKKMGDE